jgi:hypothetical protein
VNYDLLKRFFSFKEKAKIIVRLSEVEVPNPIGAPFDFAQGDKRDLEKILLPSQSLSNFMIMFVVGTMTRITSA